jgi:hypothetical protein
MPVNPVTTVTVLPPRCAVCRTMSTRPRFFAWLGGTGVDWSGPCLAVESAAVSRFFNAAKRDCSTEPAHRRWRCVSFPSCRHAPQLVVRWKKRAYGRIAHSRSRKRRTNGGLLRAWSQGPRPSPSRHQLCTYTPSRHAPYALVPQRNTLHDSRFMASEDSCKVVSSICTA